MIDTWSDYIEIENHLDEMTEIQECIDYYDQLLELDLKYKQDEEILLRLLKQTRRVRKIQCKLKKHKQIQ